MAELCSDIGRRLADLLRGQERDPQVQAWGRALRCVVDWREGLDAPDPREVFGALDAARWQEERAAALEALHDQFLPFLKAEPAARKISEWLLSYRRNAWPSTSTARANPHAPHDKEHFLWRTLKARDRVLAAETIRQLL